MIHHIFANRSNVGDWLGARAIQSLLAPWPVQEHLCDDPFVERTLAAVSQAGPEDLIVIGAGGLFMDYFLPFWRGFRDIAARVPFCIWGVGYCDRKLHPSCPPGMPFEEIVSLSRLCIVRDELTRQRLSRCALPPPVPCPSLLAVSAPAPPSQPGLLHVDHYDNVGAEIYEKMVRWGQDFAARTGRSYRQTNNRIPPNNAAAMQKTLDLYISADLVLTSRLHGCILGLAMGRKVLAVSGDHKVESFMAAAGLNEWVCDLDEIDALPRRLEALPSQEPSTQFIEWARTQNRAVAAQVRAWIAQSQTEPS